MTGRPRYWLARLVICAWMLQIPMIGWLEPQSIVARNTTSYGPPGPFFLFLLAVIAVFGIVDVLANDLVRAPFFLCGFNQRHVGYMAAAVILVLLSGVILKHDGFTPLLASLWLPALFCVAIVPLDMQARYRTP